MCRALNLVYPYVLLVAFGGLASTSLLPSMTLLAAIFARFTRMNLLPTLRGTPYALMLNAAPRKTGGLVRSFTTAMVLPLGQSVGALLLLLVKGLAMFWLLPVLGIGLAVVYIVYAIEAKQGVCRSTPRLAAGRPHPSAGFE